MSTRIHERFLRFKPTPLNSLGVTPARAQDSQTYVNTFKSSKPGRFGLPLLAWKPAGRLGADCLFLVGQNIACGQDPCTHSNGCFTISIPKDHGIVISLSSDM